MAEQITSVKPPRGAFAVVVRLPIWLYRWHAGWLLGSRFLRLEHRGRRSGQVRSVVLEVIDHDDHGGRYSVAAAWGTQAQWVRNVLSDPGVRVTVGRRRCRATAEVLPQERSEAILRRYGQQHRWAAAALSRLFGFSSFDEMAGMVRVVELTVTGRTPRSTGAPGGSAPGG